MTDQHAPSDVSNSPPHRQSPLDITSRLMIPQGGAALAECLSASAKAVEGNEQSSISVPRRLNHRHSYTMRHFKSSPNVDASVAKAFKAVDNTPVKIKRALSSFNRLSVSPPLDSQIKRSTVSLPSTGVLSSTGLLTSTASHNSSNNTQSPQHYEQMMKRFQIRRLQSTHSGSFHGSSAVSPMHPDDIEETNSLNRSANNTNSNCNITSSASPLERVPSSHPISSEQHDSFFQPSYSRSSIPTFPKNDEAVGRGQSQGHGRFSLHWTIVSWRRKLQRTNRRLLLRLSTPISPFSMICRVRGVVLLIAFVLHAVLFPVETAFYNSGHSWFVSLDITTELIFIADILLSFNTAFINKRGVLIISRRQIAREYLKGRFLVDVISAVPIEIIHVITGKHFHYSHYTTYILLDGVLRMHRIVHIVRIFRLVWIVHSRSDRSIWAWLVYSRYSHLLRIGWIILAILLFTHYMACSWKLLAISSSTSNNDSFDEKLTVLEDYTLCFYVALQLLQGQGIDTDTLAQNVFASAVVLIGSIVLAIVFGHVAMLVSNFNANTTNYQRKMEAVFAVMGKMQLPAALRERIHQYYEHLWREYESLDGEIVKFSKDLTHNLALEVVLFKYMETVMHIPYWKDCTPDLQKQIVLNIHVRVYLPDDFIIRRGEVDDEFYMINRGVCELVTGPDSLEYGTPATRHLYQSSIPGNGGGNERTDSSLYGEIIHNSERVESEAYRDTNPYRVNPDVPRTRKKLLYNTKRLMPGQAFGEMALLLNYQRTANARAMTHVEMCVLKRKNFQTILMRYPDDGQQVVANMLAAVMEHNRKNQLFCPLKDAVQSVFSNGVNASDPNEITSKFAASMISKAITRDLKENALIVDLNTKLKQDLTKLRDREHSAMQQPQHQSSVVADPATSVQIPIPTDLEQRITQLEDKQQQTLLLLQNIQQSIDQIKQSNRENIPTTGVSYSQVTNLSLQETIPLPLGKSSIQPVNLSPISSSTYMSTTQSDFPGQLLDDKAIAAAAMRQRAEQAQSVDAESNNAKPPTTTTQLIRLERSNKLNRIGTSYYDVRGGRHPPARRLTWSRNQNAQEQGSSMLLRIPRLEIMNRHSSFSDRPTSRSRISPTHYADQLFQSRRSYTANITTEEAFRAAELSASALTSPVQQSSSDVFSLSTSG